MKKLLDLYSQNPNAIKFYKPWVMTHSSSLDPHKVAEKRFNTFYISFAIMVAALIFIIIIFHSINYSNIATTVTFGIVVYIAGLIISFSKYNSDMKYIKIYCQHVEKLAGNTSFDIPGHINPSVELAVHHRLKQYAKAIIMSEQKNGQGNEEADEIRGNMVWYRDLLIEICLANDKRGFFSVFFEKAQKELEEEENSKNEEEHQVSSVS
jgi:hypothetical protein